MVLDVVFYGKKPIKIVETIIGKNTDGGLTSLRKNREIEGLGHETRQFYFWKVSIKSSKKKKRLRGTFNTD